MIKDCVMAGFGGQGIMAMGQMLSYAGMDKGFNVVWLPSYGPEMRGGTAYCTVILSDELIGSPVVSNPQFQIVMNRPSLDKFGPKVRPGGQLYINSSLINIKSDRTDIEQFCIPANDWAVEMNNPRSANLAMLGSFIARSRMLDIADIETMLRKKFAAKPKVIEGNIALLMRGYEEALKM